MLILDLLSVMVLTLAVWGCVCLVAAYYLYFTVFKKAESRAQETGVEIPSWVTSRANPYAFTHKAMCYSVALMKSPPNWIKNHFSKPAFKGVVPFFREMNILQSFFAKLYLHFQVSIVLGILVFGILFIVFEP